MEPMLDSALVTTMGSVKEQMMARRKAYSTDILSEFELERQSEIMMVHWSEN